MKKILISLLVILLIACNGVMAEETEATSDEQESSNEVIEINTEEGGDAAADNTSENSEGELPEEVATEEPTETEVPAEEPQIPELASFSSSVTYNEDHTIATVTLTYEGECEELTIANQEGIQELVNIGVYQVDLERSDWVNTIVFNILLNGAFHFDINVWGAEDLIGTSTVVGYITGLNNDALVFEPGQTEQSTYTTVSSDVGVSDSQSLEISYVTNVSYTWSIPTALELSDIRGSLPITINNSNLAPETALRVRINTANGFNLTNAEAADDLSYIVTDNNGDRVHDGDVILDHLFNQDTSSNTLNVDITRMPVYSGEYNDTWTFTASVERLLSDLYSGQAVTINQLGTTHNLIDMKIYGVGYQLQGSGKNLLNPTLQTQTVNGVTCTNNGDGTYTLNGTATNSTYLGIGILTVPSGTYKLLGCPSSGASATYFLYDDNKNGLSDYGSGAIKEFTSEVSLSIYIYVNSGVTLNNITFKPMLTDDLSATYYDFEPYVGGIPTPSPDNPSEIQSVVNPKLSVNGKNLLNSTLQTTTTGGVTCTNNGDGTYTLNGTCVNPYNSDFILGNISLKKGSYKLVGCPKNGSSMDFSLRFRLNANSWGIYSDEYGSGLEINISEDSISDVVITINTGKTINNLTFKPMLTTDLNATYDDFEPFKSEQSATLPYTLNAIPVSEGGNVTIDGQQYIADYVDIENKQLVRMVDKVDMGTLDYTYESSYTRFYSSSIANTLKIVTGISNNLLCDTFKAHVSPVGSSKKDNTICFYSNRHVYINCFNYTDATTFKNAVSGKYLIYPLETPTIINLTDDEVQAFKDLYTYTPTTTVITSSDQLTPSIEFGLS